MGHSLVSPFGVIRFVTVLPVSMAKSVGLLWGMGSRPCWRVTITLEVKKLQGYKHRLLSLEKGDHKSEEVLEINLRGQLGLC